MFNKIFRLIFPAKDEFTIRREYHIPDKIKLSISIKEGGWIVVTSSELPGLITQARNCDELLDVVNDAVLTYYDVPRKVGDVIFDKIDIDGVGVISYTRQHKKALQTN